MAAFQLYGTSRRAALRTAKPPATSKTNARCSDQRGGDCDLDDGCTYCEMSRAVANRDEGRQENGRVACLRLHVRSQWHRSATTCSAVVVDIAGVAMAGLSDPDGRRVGYGAGSPVPLGDLPPRVS